jgi:hypothetical protein
MKEHGARELCGAYWSSSENSQTNAWNVNLTSGSVLGYLKYGAGYVRAVSAF